MFAFYKNFLTLELHWTISTLKNIRYTQAGHDKLGKKFAEVFCRGLAKFAEVRPNLQRFGQFCRGLVKFAEVWPNLQRFGQFCRGLAKFAEVWPILQRF